MTTTTDTAELVADLLNEAEAYRGRAVARHLHAAADRLTALERELMETTVIARSLTKALVQLTPGGSEYFTRHGEEYFADIEACHRVIRDRVDSGHRAKLERVDERRRAEEAERALVASQAEVERLKEDAERMDWLVSQHVEVRTPLVYGSRAGFVAQTLSDEEDAEHRTDLREQIDRARAALQPQVGK